jgi:anti-sigma factor RsiW
MHSCASLDSLVPAFIDGETSDADTEGIERHLQACERCRARVDAERVVHDLLRARREALRDVRAPSPLLARCRELAAASRMDVPPARPAPFPSTRVAARWPARVRPLAIAASLVLIVASAFLYRMTHTSAGVIASELTADHVKCFMVNAVLGTHHSHAAVESSLARSFGWSAQLPPHPEQEGLELVGARPCLSGEGRVAHIMYRHEGRPVSVFMLPGARGPEALLDVLGHQALLWSEGERTFVLIARESEEETKRLVSFLRRTLR